MSSNVMIEACCNRCKTHFSDLWITRNYKGEISLEGLVCGNCGVKNCMQRVWNNGLANTIMPVPEDGNINRFEYSYTTPDGKRVNKKMDPQMVEKHFKMTNKG